MNCGFDKLWLPPIQTPTICRVLTVLATQYIGSDAESAKLVKISPSEIMRRLLENAFQHTASRPLRTELQRGRENMVLTFAVTIVRHHEFDSVLRGFLISPRKSCFEEFWLSVGLGALACFKIGGEVSGLNREAFS